MAFGLHHLQQRKRPGAYPHPDPRIRLLDGMVYLLAFVSPTFAIPQLIDVWVHHTVGGISLFYWMAQAVASAIWLTYGIVHKERPIIITNSLWAMLNLFVAIGVFVYR